MASPSSASRDLAAPLTTFDPPTPRRLVSQQQVWPKVFAALGGASPVVRAMFAALRDHYTTQTRIAPMQFVSILFPGDVPFGSIYLDATVIPMVNHGGCTLHALYLQRARTFTGPAYFSWRDWDETGGVISPASRMGMIPILGVGQVASAIFAPGLVLTKGLQIELEDTSDGTSGGSDLYVKGFFGFALVG